MKYQVEIMWACVRAGKVWNFFDFPGENVTTLLKIRSDKLIIVNLSWFTITRWCKSSDNNRKKASNLALKEICRTQPKRTVKWKVVACRRWHVTEIDGMSREKSEVDEGWEKCLYRSVGGGNPSNCNQTHSHRPFITLSRTCFNRLVPLNDPDHD